MRSKNVHRGSIDLKIKVIDWTKINQAISKDVGQEVECRLGNGFIENVEAIFDDEIVGVEIKSLIIDKECCGSVSEKRNFYISELNAGEPFGVNLFKGIGFYKVNKETEKGFSVSMFPSYYFDIDIDDIKNCLTGEEIPLYQFMGSRYAYNGRIENNEMNILRLVYYKDKKNGFTDWAKTEILEIAD